MITVNPKQIKTVFSLVKQRHFPTTFIPPDICQNLYHDTLLSCLEFKDKFDETKGSWVNIIYTKARNIIGNYIKSSQHRTVYSEELFDTSSTSVGGDGDVLEPYKLLLLGDFGTKKMSKETLAKVLFFLYSVGRINIDKVSRFF